MTQSIGVMQNQQQEMPQLFEEGEDDDDGDGMRKRAPTKLRNTFEGLIAASSAKHNFASFEGNLFEVFENVFLLVKKSKIIEMKNCYYCLAWLLYRFLKTRVAPFKTKPQFVGKM